MAYTTIDKPTDYFNTTLWTGTGSSMTITGVGHQPDWVWIKPRSVADNHVLFDSVRGATQRLVSNSTSAEATLSGDDRMVESFDSDGYTLGGNSNATGSGRTFVGWSWVGGGSASSNTDGSITSTVSANTTAGFSIVTYDGNSTAGATVGHGLGVVPSVVLVKSRDGAYGWGMYHHKNTSAPETDYLSINNTDATVDDVNFWNDTAPTSSVFSLGGTDAINKTSNGHVAYCFAEKKGYSKFGSYTSINSHDSTFVYLGFKPAMIIFKNTSYSGGSDWNILDRTRYTFNSSSEAVLEPNTSDAENYSAFGEVDFLSNGFKIRNNNGVSSGGYDHIYMAFAESPFVTSTGIPTTAR